MTQVGSDWVYHRGRMAPTHELPFWRRFLRWAMKPIRLLRRGVRRRFLAQWATSELREEQ